MEIRHEGPINGIAVIALSGRVLISTGSDRIAQVALSLLEQGARGLIFDLTEVTHLDSTGIGQFIATMSAGLKKGLKIVMAGANPAVRESFHVTRLDSVFKFAATVEEARALLG